jgi:small subunit ribosomal protein S2
MNWVRELSARGGVLLFVGTKKQAQETIEEEARRCGMPFVSQRWMGGTLTNFQTILSRIRRMEELEQRKERGDWDYLPKKEAAKLDDELTKLHRLLGGFAKRYRLPEAVFIVDPHREQNTVHEAQRMEIPIVAMVDTNCNPEQIDHPIPANDDAIRAIRLITGKIADAVLEGQQHRESTGVDGQDAEAEESEDSKPIDIAATSDLADVFEARERGVGAPAAFEAAATAAPSAVEAPVAAPPPPAASSAPTVTGVRAPDRDLADGDAPGAPDEGLGAEEQVSDGQEA